MNRLCIASNAEVSCIKNGRQMIEQYSMRERIKLTYIEFKKSVCRVLKQQNMQFEARDMDLSKVL